MRTLVKMDSSPLKAAKVVASSEVIRLSAVDQLAFAQALIQPVLAPNEAMLKAATQNSRVAKGLSALDKLDAAFK